MISKLGGLNVISNSSTTGWKHFAVAPDMHAVARLGVGGYALETRFGHAAVSWVYDSTSKQLYTNVTVPFGSTAEIIHEHSMPAKSSRNAAAYALHQVYEQKELLWSRDQSAQLHRPGGVADVREGPGWTMSVVGGGTFEFMAQY
jgi:hypothetical protein